MVMISFPHSTIIMSSWTFVKTENIQVPSCKRIPNSAVLLQQCHHVQEIRQIHAQFVTSGLMKNHHLNIGRLIHSYVSADQIHYASSVFKTHPSPDVFAYNTMIRGLTLAGCPYNSILFYNQLLLTALLPDNYSYTFVLKACSHLKSLTMGKQVHARIIKHGISPLGTHIHTSLVHMYANSGSIGSARQVLNDFCQENVLANNAMIAGCLNQGFIYAARKVFDKMTTRDTASWSAMISGYTKNGMYTDALAVFAEMMASHVPLNESTLVSTLSACSHLGALDQGKRIHAYIDKHWDRKAAVSVTLGTCLVDMYANCGCIESSYEIFQSMPRKDVVMWGAMISGFCVHGQPQKCFQLFDEMISSGVLPNEVILVALLSACLHCGHVELGKFYFKEMERRFKIGATIKHYGCMVDLLGRAGRLAEAEEMLVSSIKPPLQANAVMWGSMLAACRIHKDLRRGERAFKELLNLEAMSGERYKLVGHLFAETGKNEEVDKVRKFVKDENLAMRRGSSFIEVNGVVNRFVAGDIHHKSLRQIYQILDGYI